MAQPNPNIVMNAKRPPDNPDVHLHNRVLAAENGRDSMKHWFAARSELGPFILAL